MAITYDEFETTPAGLIAALKTRILSNGHWTDQGVVPTTTTNTVATVSASAVATLSSLDGILVGQWITVNPGAGNEIQRQITAINGNVITVLGNWGAVYPIGTTFKARSTVLKSTTDNGSELILDLEGDIQTNYMSVMAYRQYTGTATGGWTDAKQSWLYWKAAAGTTAMPLHVTLSVGKNHLFFAIEGPRAHEVSPTSTTYGSVKNYFALSELTKYHAADTTPVAISIGVPTGIVTTTVAAGGHQVGISRDSTDVTSWSIGRLASLDFPTVYTTDVVNMNRACSIDGNTYLLPYVLFSETEGIRGRLTNFFYCNTTAPSPVTDLPDPVGTRVTYNGIVYKLTAVNKGDGSASAWGPFGAITQSTLVTRSIIVAIPYAVAAA